MNLWGAFLAVITCVLLHGCQSGEAHNNTEIMQIHGDITFLRGVNASHYLSQIGDRPWANPASCNEEDFAWIASRGYDHIRLPVDGPLLLNHDGSIRMERLGAIDQVLQWAASHGLGVILDMHKLPGSNFARNPDNRLFKDPALQQVAVRLWAHLAERYRSIGPQLRFEILNEPVAGNAADLTAFYAKVVPVIRKVSPERKIILCSNRWGSFHTVEALEPLLDDKNLVVAVHYYEPHVFTHQGASWVGLDHKEMPSIPFPGKLPDLRPYVDAEHYAHSLTGADLTAEAIEKDFRELAAWALRHNVELHLGEFGAYEAADPKSRERWYRTVLDQCVQHGIGWAVWDYKGGFAVRDRHTGQPTLVQEILRDYLPEK